MLKSFWNQFVGSMVKTDRYEIFIQRPVSKAALYLVTLIFMITVVNGVRVSLAWNGFVDQMEMALETGAPDFSFVNGEVKVNAPMPYVISRSKSNLLVVDTSGKINENVLKDYSKGIFIGKNKLVNKQSLIEVRSYDLTGFKEISFTKADVVKAVPWMKWFNIVFVFCMFMYVIISNLFAALLICICGWITSKILKMKILFADIYKISIYTLSLPLLLELGKDLLKVNIPFFDLFFYIIAFIYMVRVLKKRKHNIIESE